MTAISFELQAEARSDLGRRFTRRMRRSGKIPAVVYGGSKAPKSLLLEERSLNKQLADENFFSHILTLKSDEGSEQVIIKSLQRHPCRGDVMHLDFQRVSQDKRIKVRIPLHFLHEESAAGVKMGGRIEHFVPNVEVLCLPKDLPSFIAVDLTEVQLGQVLHLSDLKMPENVQVAQLALGSDHDMPVVGVVGKIK